MNLKEFNILLDIKKQYKSEQIEIVRGDINTNVLNIALTNGANPYDLYGLDVNIVFKKADGTTVQQVNIEKVNDVQGKIKCVLKTNTIACVGKVVAEVKIISEGKLLTSTNFSFYVRDSLLNDETIESTDEFPILTQLIDQTNQLIDAVRQIEEQVPQSVVDRINALETTTDALSTTVIDKIDKSMIVQNAISTNPDTVASGPAVKYVNDRVNDLNNKLVYSSTEVTEYLNGYIAYSDGIILKKIGNIVTVRIAINSTNGVLAPYTPIAVIPNGFRPTTHPVPILGKASNGTLYDIAIRQDGVIIVGDFTFATVGWFIATATYIV